MKAKLWRGLVLLALLLVSCAPSPTPLVITVVVPATPLPAASTLSSVAAETLVPTLALVQPTPTTGKIPVTAPTDPPASTNTPMPAATTGPQCTVLQNVNFRIGPGLAYNPPVDALIKGAVVIPQAFQPAGFPGGAWVQVLNPGNNKIGWISAGTDYVQCSIDLKTLPAAQFPPTPTPDAPQVTNSQPKGNFDGLVWKLHFSESYLMRMEIYRDGGQKDGDGMKFVHFVIDDGKGTVVRDQTEKNAPYCVFGGGDTCATWPKVNGHYAWANKGPEVAQGTTYNVNINAEAEDGTAGNWNFTITITTP